MAYHVVKESDHLARLAHRHGVTPDAIWSHDSNASLREQRGDGSILRAGDVVFVPDAPARQPVMIAAGSTTTFTAQVARVPLRVVLKTGDGAAIAGEPFQLDTPAETLTGTTDGDGTVDVQVRVFVGRAHLYLDNRQEHYEIDIGGLDPLSELSGVQMRLRNLGFFVGRITGALDEPTRNAVSRFQTARGLDPTGEVDDATQQELGSAHRC